MNAPRASIVHRSIVVLAVAMSLLPAQAWAQMDPGMAMPMPAKKKAPGSKPVPKQQQASKQPHDMGAMPATDHASMQHAASAPSAALREPVPALTDADRAAAFPQVAAHAMHDNDIHRLVVFDRFEAWNANKGTALEWEGSAWIGTDLNRLWIRSEGQRSEGRLEDADLEVLYGRSVAAWWDVVVGMRHDFKPGAAQDFAAIGVMGTASGKLGVKATAYLGASGQTAARIEAGYDVLLTNRLILQPLVEINAFGRNDPRRGIGSGLGTVEAGLRLRYEITRQFAPYVGIVRTRALGGTAGFHRAGGEDIDDTRLVAGLRFWF